MTRPIRLTLVEPQPPVPGREAICPDCHLVYWIAGGHDCDRTAIERNTP